MVLFKRFVLLGFVLVFAVIAWLAWQNMQFQAPLPADPRRGGLPEIGAVASPTPPMPVSTPSDSTLAGSTAAPVVNRDSPSLPVDPAAAFVEAIRNAPKVPTPPLTQTGGRPMTLPEAIEAARAAQAKSSAESQSAQISPFSVPAR